MKCVIVGPAFPLRGGIANLNESLCKAFNDNNIECEIVSFTLQYPEFLFPGKTQFDETGKAPAGLKITALINSINPFSWGKTVKYIVNLNPDFVVLRFWLPFMGPALGTIAKKLRKKGIKVIAITDNVIPHESKPGDYQLTRYFLKQCDAFVAMSQSVLEDIRTFVDNPKTKFIPHPIYDIFGKAVSKREAREHLNLKQDEKIVLFFGFIRKYKGLDLMLEAFGEEIVKSKNIKLIVAGEFYEEEEPYLAQIKQLGIEGSVTLKKDFIPGDEVKYYFCAADIIAQPYRTATQSGVTQIGYHFDKPMLVTNVGGLAEIIPHNKVGYVCEVDASSIANSLSDFFENNRVTEFTNNVIEEKKKFSWENMVNGITDLVKSL
ncbi:MAG: glycosyltransferase [Flavobacteriales bacterium]|nr:glycosyltransferase [Flavobacteriales bacterium]